MSKAANLIEGKSNPTEDAKERLKNARSEIASIIRKKSLYDGINSDESDISEGDIPMKKRKKTHSKSKKKLSKKKGKKYNLYKDF